MYFEKSIASRLDYIENTFFSRLFTESIRFWFPPFPKFQQTLVKEGAPNNRVQVMGDLRFDSLNVAGAPKNTDLKQILERYRLAEGPLLVAGSVNYIDEWKCLVGAWQALKIHYPHTKLIIAPRYVNEPKVINALVNLLTTENIDFVLRSNPLSNLELKDVLVVDVFGELSHYYSIASISYIGRNHGVLEPLAYSCPTIVGKGWRQDYSAYPLYEYMVSQQGVICIEDQADLVQVTERLLEDQSFRNQRIQTARRVVAENAGAAERMMSVITKSLNHH
jgi:3-deoxy-D-manno-octulosonic-acid transferase